MSAVEHPWFRWFVLVSLVVITAAAAMSSIAPAPLVGVIAQDFHLSLGEVTGMSMLAYMLATAISCIAGGFLIDRIGFNKVWIFCMSLGAIAAILHFFTGNTPGSYLCIRLLQGFAGGPVMAVIAVVCVQWFKYGERTYIVSAQGVSLWIGLSLGLIYTPWLNQVTQNWHHALGLSCVPLLIGLVFSGILAFGPQPAPIAKKVEIGAGEHGKGDLRVAIGCAATWAVFVCIILDCWYQQAFNDLAPGFYAVAPPAGLGLGPIVAGRHLMWAGYASILGTMTAAVVVEKMFKGKPRIPLFVACSLSAILMLCVHFLTSRSGAILTLLPVAMLFFSSFVNPTVLGFVTKHYPGYIAGRVGGIASGLAVIGAVMGLAIGAMLLHVTGYYYVPMVVMAGVIFIAGVGVSFLVPPEVYALELSNQQAAQAAGQSVS